MRDKRQLPRGAGHTHKGLISAVLLLPVSERAKIFYLFESEDS